MTTLFPILVLPQPTVSSRIERDEPHTFEARDRELSRRKNDPRDIELETYTWSKIERPLSTRE
jgi:hypothetical protein